MSSRSTARRLTRFRGQAAWTLVDQAVSSLGTLVLAVAVGRGADVASFGAFATAITVYALALTASRAAVCMPDMMRSTEGGGHGVDPGALPGSAVVLAAPISLAILAAGLLSQGPVRDYLLLLAVTTPFLLLQDAYRFLLRRRDRSRSVAVNDTIWTAVQVGLSSLMWSGLVEERALWHFGCWGVGVLVALVHAWCVTRVAPAPGHGLRSLVETRRVAAPLLVEAMATNGSNSLAQFVIATFGGLAVLAPVKGAHVVLGPVNVLNGGLVFLVTPIFLRLGAAGDRRLLACCVAFAAVIAGSSMAVGITVLALPAEYAHHVLGQTGELARAVVLPTALALSAYGAQTAAALGIQAYRAPTRSMVVRLATFPVPSVAAVLGIVVGGVEGAAYGLFLGAALSAALLWITFLRLRPRRAGGRAGPDAPASRSTTSC